MSKDLTKQSNDVEQLNEVKKICDALKETPHYRKLGNVGIFTIVEKAKSIGVSPIEALNGGMFFVAGKVEMTSALMNQLIRKHGHSISKDSRSNDKICILHGKRADNGDTWTASFSIEEAKKAGIFSKTWEKYTSDMLFARALTRLARQLFPDVIKGCYVEGEIDKFGKYKEEPSYIEEAQEFEWDKIIEVPQTIGKAQIEELLSYMEGHDTLQDNLLAYLQNKGIESFGEIPVSQYDNILSKVKKYVENKRKEA